MVNLPIEIHFETFYSLLKRGWPHTTRESNDGIWSWEYIWFGLEQDSFYDGCFFNFLASIEHYNKVQEEENINPNFLVKLDQALEQNRVESQMLFEMIQILKTDGLWDIPGRNFCLKYRKELTLWYMNIYNEKMKSI